jgi:hypothetical protein
LNDRTCPEGISSYHSNFTFEQPQANPWNPFSDNEPDNLVHQQEHITLSSCAKFSLTSDGREEGTAVADHGRDDGKPCPKIQKIPVATAGTERAKDTGPTQRPQYVATGGPEQYKSIAASRRLCPKRILLIAFLLIAMLLPPGAHASPSDHHRQSGLRQRAELRIRAISDKVKAFAQDFSNDFAEKADAKAQNGEALAHNLVAAVVSSVCHQHLNSARPDDFTPGVV